MYPLSATLGDRKEYFFYRYSTFCDGGLIQCYGRIHGRHEKMNIYCKVGVSEYWIVDWRKKSPKKSIFLTSKRDGTGYPVSLLKQLLHRIRGVTTGDVPRFKKITFEGIV